MLKNEIKSKGAPPAIGPYSQAVELGGYIYCSGQIGVDPERGEMKEGIKGQTNQVLKNLQEVLKSAGANFDDVVKTTVYMTDLGEFAVMNKIYESYFKKPYPARATIQVAALPKGAKVEIEAIAYVGS